MSPDPLVTPMPMAGDDSADAADRKHYEPPRLVVLSAASTAGKAQFYPSETLGSGPS